MDETKHSSALILQRSAYRENDSLITVYTKKFGKLSLLARGTKKLQSKLAGHLEPISLADILVIKGRGFDYVGSAITRDAFLGIKNDLNKVYYAGRAIALFNRLIKENQAEERLFFLLYRWLEALADYEAPEFTKESGELFGIFFAWKLLAELGYQPEMYECLNCRQKIKSGLNYFNLASGGVVCGACFQDGLAPQGAALSGELIKISDNAIKLLRFILENKFNQTEKVKIDKRVVKELAALANSFVHYRN